MSDTCTFIIDRLVEERHRRGLTQQELAQLTGLTQSVIARLENKRSVPQLDTLLRVVDALECTLEIVPSA